MKRRDFLRTSASVALLGGAYFYGLNKVAGFKPPSSADYDLVAIKGADPATMFDKAISSLGGMSKYVSSGQKVVVKPNIGWDVVPERAGNTNPSLVRRIVEHCLEAGAKQVYVFDNTCDKWTKCYENSGIERAAKDGGATVVPGNTESYYQEVAIPEAKILKTTKVHELILETDVLINVPVLKNHMSATLTIAMKNLMGVVWDRFWWHKNNLHQCIADYTTFRKPDLNVIDAYNVMMKNGPRGVSTADVSQMKTQIISSDIVAADTAAAALLDHDPGSVKYIKYAEEMGLGTTKLNELNINRIIL
jgi:uncharacterized protein (DUF362 family)